MFFCDWRCYDLSHANAAKEMVTNTVSDPVDWLVPEKLNSLSDKIWHASQYELHSVERVDSCDRCRHYMLKLIWSINPRAPQLIPKAPAPSWLPWDKITMTEILSRCSRWFHNISIYWTSGIGIGTEGCWSSDRTSLPGISFGVSRAVGEAVETGDTSISCKGIFLRKLTKEVVHIRFHRGVDLKL